MDMEVFCNQLLSFSMFSTFIPCYMLNCVPPKGADVLIMPVPMKSAFI